MNTAFLLKILDKLPEILSFLGFIVLVWLIFYIKNIHKLIDNKEKEIFKTKNDIDNMESSVHKKTAGWINQSQLEKIADVFKRFIK